MEKKPRNRQSCAVTICVDSYENGVFAGQISSLGLEENLAFKSLSQLLLQIDDLLDETKFPQSFMARRSFASGQKESEETSTPAGGAFQRGKLATFCVQVRFRQNASWQGSVLWREGNQEQSFRSVLELIFLMDSALKS